MNLPFLIPTRDRHRCLFKLLDTLGSSMPFGQIHIVDMDSTFPRMLDVLKGLEDIGINVHRRDNLGARGMLRDEAIRKVVGDKPFFMSDPDVVPARTIRPDFMEHMERCIARYTDYHKIGLTLLTDDLPDHYPRKREVIEWESRFTKNKVNVHLYDAEVATTFCIVRGLRHLDKDANVVKGKQARLVDCHARHLPWYWNPDSMWEDDAYYVEHAPKRRPGVPEPGITWTL